MNTSFCPLAEALSKEYFLRYFLLLKAVSCVPAFVLPILLLKLTVKNWRLSVQGTRWLVHPNARIIYATHVAWMIELPLTYTFVYVYDFTRLTLDHQNPCDYMVSVDFSFNTRVLPVIGLIGQMFTMLSLAIERAVSTLTPTKYEGIRHAHLGIALSIASSLGAVVLPYAMLFPNINWGTYLITYSMRTPENANMFQHMTVMEVIVEIVTIVIFSVSLLRNNHFHQTFIMTKTARLANRYQVTENRRIIRTLLPVFVVHFCFLFINGLGLSIYPNFFPVWNPASHSIWLESIGQVHVYSIVMPLLLLSKMSSSVAPVVNNLQKQDDYFQTLKMTFEAGPLRGR